ncbi:MAG: Para-hydroxybenzoate--polyprenyltransferase, mitochondrial precursor (PHB:polyprenyltransferase) [Vezdaea acicularis]|nr:MAG: Para-hydroxybenzoate--polyprenyltransferase, mitochondrial precursor (PHB:polyprenyltransferase) [Vezdaea acicularis]
MAAWKHSAGGANLVRCVSRSSCDIERTPSVATEPLSSSIKGCLQPRTAVSNSQTQSLSRKESSSALLSTLNDKSPPTSILPPYVAPNSGILARLPASWIPYAELVRLDKPTGTYYLFFPTLFSTLMAGSLTNPITSPISLATTISLFFTGALVMRGAGCTINDLWDRNLDPHVTRTRLRPIARGAVTPKQAIVFTGFQLLAGLAVLLQFPRSCLYYGIPSLLFVVAYPLAKRVTYYPQFVLGLTFSWGAIMGFPALGIDLLSNQAALSAAAFLYASNVAWTVLYDMIYAHMDIRDDAAAGIKSIVLRHEKNTKSIMSILAMTQIGLLAAAGITAGAGPVFFISSCGGTALTLAIMIKRVKLKDVKDCWWWFRNGCWFTGGAISIGLLGDYTLRLSGLQEQSGQTAEIHLKASLEH